MTPFLDKTVISDRVWEPFSSKLSVFHEKWCFRWFTDKTVFSLKDGSLLRDLNTELMTKTRKLMTKQQNLTVKESQISEKCQFLQKSGVLLMTPCLPGCGPLTSPRVPGCGPLTSPRVPGCDKLMTPCLPGCDKLMTPCLPEWEINDVTACTRVGN